VKRVAADLPPQASNQINAALQLHQRYRFDPDGITATERNRLRELCRSIALPRRTV